MSAGMTRDGPPSAGSMAMPWKMLSISVPSMASTLPMRTPSRPVIGVPRSM